jgi:hypothetical protein
MSGDTADIVRHLDAQNVRTGKDRHPWPAALIAWLRDKPPVGIGAGVHGSAVTMPIGDAEGRQPPPLRQWTGGVIKAGRVGTADATSDEEASATLELPLWGKTVAKA